MKFWQKFILTFIGGLFFGVFVLAAIDAEVCRQERENLHEQQCLFAFNCR